MIDQRRRLLCTVLGCALAPCAVGAARAQQPGRVYRIGWVGLTSVRSERYNIAFVQRLEELGFVEGRNLELVIPRAPFQLNALDAVAQELSKARCDVLFAGGTESTLIAAERVSPDTPIVIVSNDYDPVGTGHVANMARPGGRVTGVSQLQVELPAKRLEVLRELIPSVQKVAVLGDAASHGQMQVTREAATKLGMQLVAHEFNKAPYDYPQAFEGFVRAKAEALVQLASGYFVSARKTIVDLARQHRLPAIYNNVVWAEHGGLLSYGPNFSASYRRAAEQVAKILNGARPGDMPIEQPSAIEWRSI